MGLSVPCSVVAVNLQRLQGAPIVRESEVEFVTATLGTDVVVVADGIWQRPQNWLMGVVMKNPDLLLCTPWLVEENTLPRVESHRESISNGYWKLPCSNPFGIQLVDPICPDDPEPQHASLPFDRVAQVGVPGRHGQSTGSPGHQGLRGAL